MESEKAVLTFHHIGVARNRAMIVSLNLCVGVFSGLSPAQLPFVARTTLSVGDASVVISALRQRCLAASVRTSRIAFFSPAWSSEKTNTTQ
jgi:hypothetical protein